MRFGHWAVATLLVLAAPAAAQAQNAALVNPNTASQEDLARVPHMTPALVQDVIAKRPLASPLALDAVLAKTLSAEQRKQAYSRMFVPLNLNTATIDDIMLIPGMSRRMSAEFREYRPYRSIGQFRHEIGKYVDKAEVKRLESYVFVPAK
ncbi:MAG TPA: hypothetical protein VL026_10235 [Rhizomicrobium sp.]|nr:hypothetical protein [Rhizomicrobium sp.]